MTEFLKAVRDRPVEGARMLLEYVDPIYRVINQQNPGADVTPPEVAELQGQVQIHDWARTYREAGGLGVSVGYGPASAGIDVGEVLFSLAGRSESDQEAYFNRWLQDNSGFMANVGGLIFDSATGARTDPNSRRFRDIWEVNRGRIRVCLPRDVLKNPSSCPEAAAALEPVLNGVPEAVREDPDRLAAYLESRYGAESNGSRQNIQAVTEDLTERTAFLLIPGPDGGPRVVSRKDLDEFLEGLSAEDRARADADPNELARLYNGRNPPPTTPAEARAQLIRTRDDTLATVRATTDLLSLFTDAEEVGLLADVGAQAVDFAFGVALLATPGPLQLASLAGTVSSGVGLVKTLFGNRRQGPDPIQEAVNAILRNQRLMLESLQRVERELAELRRDVFDLRNEVWVQFDHLARLIGDGNAATGAGLDQVLYELGELERQVVRLDDNLRKQFQTIEEGEVVRVYDNIADIVSSPARLAHLETDAGARDDIEEDFSAVMTFVNSTARSPTFVDTSPINAETLRQSNWLSGSLDDDEGDAVGHLNGVLSWLGERRAEFGLTRPLPATTLVSGVYLVNPVQWRRGVHLYLTLAASFSEDWFTHSNRLTTIRNAGEEHRTAAHELRGSVPLAFDVYTRTARLVADELLTRLPQGIHEATLPLSPFTLTGGYTGWDALLSPQPINPLLTRSFPRGVVIRYGETEEGARRVRVIVERNSTRIRDGSGLRIGHTVTDPEFGVMYDYQTLRGILQNVGWLRLADRYEIARRMQRAYTLDVGFLFSQWTYLIFHGCYMKARQSHWTSSAIEGSPFIDESTGGVLAGAAEWCVERESATRVYEALREDIVDTNCRFCSPTYFYYAVPSTSSERKAFQKYLDSWLLGGRPNKCSETTGGTRTLLCNPDPLRSLIGRPARMLTYINNPGYPYIDVPDVAQVVEGALQQSIEAARKGLESSAVSGEPGPASGEYRISQRLLNRLDEAHYAYRLLTDFAYPACRESLQAVLGEADRRSGEQDLVVRFPVQWVPRKVARGRPNEVERVVSFSAPAEDARGPDHVRASDVFSPFSGRSPSEAVQEAARSGDFEQLFLIAAHLRSVSELSWHDYVSRTGVTQLQRCTQPLPDIQVGLDLLNGASMLFSDMALQQAD